MKVIPVLDIKGGHAVHAIAGQRDKYQPVKTCLTGSSDPVVVAKAYRDAFGLKEMYLADLDAIAGNAPQFQTYSGITNAGIRLMVDAGIRDEPSFCLLAATGLDATIVGLESISGPEALQRIAETEFSQKLVFSLDLKAGKALGDLSAWPDASPESIADEALSRGVKRMIVLDLANVGTGNGTGTSQLCRHVLNTCPDIELITGGGIRGRDDLLRERDLGASGVLIATALHDGRIGIDEIDEVR
ncbi:MAG: HisA/HisF-related TIM barrel protein [Planctomycetota bacterium]|nr:HisA/HisF-related TIM barrel protein [Planctomycetota bacterium]